jgi:integrase/recombinase XerD
MLDQLQMQEGRWVIVDLIGKGRRLRTVSVPSWSKHLLDTWLSHSGVSQRRVFRRVSKLGKRREAGVTANVVWYAVK